MRSGTKTFTMLGITLLAVLAPGCMPAPQRVSLVPGVAVAPERELAIWRGAHADTLHVIRLTDSTVSGVPLHSPPECDSCRVSLVLTQVDSTTRTHPPRHWLSLALPAAAAVAFAGVWTWGD